MQTASCFAQKARPKTVDGISGAEILSGFAEIVLAPKKSVIGPIVFGDLNGVEYATWNDWPRKNGRQHG